MKYIFLSVIFFILNYQSVYATENTMNREYFSEIHNTLQNNHYSRGECVGFRIDHNVKGGIAYDESPKSNKRFKPNCNDVILFNDRDIYFGTYKQVDIDGQSRMLPNNLGVIKDSMMVRTSDARNLFHSHFFEINLIQHLNVDLIQ